MSEREAWYARLAESPDDSGLRKIFADWLDDRGEAELASGYRALGEFGRVMMYMGKGSGVTGVFGKDRFSTVDAEKHVVTVSWYKSAFDAWVRHPDNRRGWQSLGDCEDNAALAWSRLTPQQQREAAELLAPQEEPCQSS